MKRTCITPYQIARDTTYFTREYAAEKLEVSVRSLADYELGKTVPGDDIVCKMIELYGTEWLGYEHLKSTEIGQRYLPDVDYTDLAKSVLRLQKEIGDVQNINMDMISIACDGVVDNTERDRWGRITKEVFEVAAAAMSIMFSNQV